AHMDQVLELALLPAEPAAKAPTPRAKKPAAATPKKPRKTPAKPTPEQPSLSSAPDLGYNRAR
ncbi:MAG: hypothetical protein ACK4P1_02655, partial [Aggregatilineales bacterium]